MNVKRRQFSYIALITVFFFVCVDLLLGWIYPKIHAPTKYGWSVSENKILKRKIQDTKDNFRKVSVQYYSYGFKRWPVDSASNLRVLIVGDSFTQMNWVSNGEEWYAYLEKAFPYITFYVFGGGGYGTLQEYMIIDDHIDSINPDAIILQFCKNDYANNYYALDKRDYPFNNHHVRPYWENNDIIYRLPLPYPNLREYSFSADRLLHLYDRKRLRAATNDLSEYRKRRKEEQNSLNLREKKAFELDKRKSVEVTKMLAKQIRSRVGNIPVYFFQACGKLTDTDRSICEAGDFRFIENIHGYLKNIESRGVQIRVENNGHWNYSGNEYVGEKLAEYFKGIGGIIPGIQQPILDH